MCRCLGGCSHAMSRNEEQAWEEWDDVAATHLAQMHSAVRRLKDAVLKRDPTEIVAALQDADEAEEFLFALRHGPERPE
jgi:hypothetical protein